MKHKRLRFGEGFRVPFTVRRAQAAEMVIPPGGREGDDENRHRGADQWLFVLSGRGIATVEGERIELARGTLLLIERGERHSVANAGRTLLKTLNFYSPPAFRPDGEPLPAGRKTAPASSKRRSQGKSTRKSTRKSPQKSAQESPPKSPGKSR